MATLKKILSFIDGLSESFGKLFSFLVLIMIALQVVEVFRKHVLHSPTTWAWELITMMYGIGFIMGGAWVLKEGRHVRTDIFFDRFSPRDKAVIDLILFTVIFFSFAGVMTYMSINHAIYSWQIKETSYTMWAPPFYPLKIAIALGFVLLFLQGLAKWIRDLIFVVKGEEL